MLEIHTGCAHDFTLSIVQIENKKHTPISTIFSYIGIVSTISVGNHSGKPVASHWQTLCSEIDLTSSAVIGTNR